jgi:hypothetical protein
VKHYGLVHLKLRFEKNFKTKRRTVNCARLANAELTALEECCDEGIVLFKAHFRKTGRPVSSKTQSNTSMKKLSSRVVLHSETRIGNISASGKLR